MVQMTPSARATSATGTRLSADDVRLRLGPMPTAAIGQWLYRGLRAAIVGGELGGGGALPSSRVLAAELGIARGTVTGALDQLLAEGLLRSVPRSGMVPIPPSTPGPGTRTPTSRQAPTSPGTPDPALFPRTAWARAFRDGLAGLSGEDLGYPDVQGLPWLRSELAAHLHRSRGAVVDPDAIVVVAGVAQGYALMARALGTGTVVAMEDPGSPGSSEMLTQLGLTLSPTPVDADGIDVSALAPGAGAVVVTPAHQYPTGVPLAPQRRRELVAWARDGGRPGWVGGRSGWVGGRLIIEDDYDAELRYDRDPVPALQGLAPDRVVLAGSISKTLSPALRLGWLVAPAELIGPLVDGKRASDLGCSVPEQAALAGFLRSGGYGRHTRRVRGIYRRRRQLLYDALAEAVDAPELGVPVLGVPAGLHLVVELGSGVQERVALDAVAAARADPVVDNAIAAQPLSAGSFGRDRFGLVIGTARINQAAAAAVVQGVLAAIQSRPRRTRPVS